MVGINKYTEKERREQRRRNHIARDLKTSKYHQRVVPSATTRTRKWLNTDSVNSDTMDEGYHEDD